MSEAKPLFIPLNGEYFDAFQAGTKTEELRLFGPRWNLGTCWAGRPVVLSRGYGKAHRINGVVTSAIRSSFYRLPKIHQDALVACYGWGFSGDILRIGIQLAPPPTPFCEECNVPKTRYTDPNTGREGWGCDSCGWSQDD